MPLRPRIEAALDSKYTLDAGGDETVEVDIRGEGIDRTDVSSDPVVEDFIVEDSGDYHLYVSAKTKGRYVGST